MRRLLQCLCTVGLLTFAGVASGQENANCARPGDYAIVDAHTHIFNLRYFPIKGILLRYRVPRALAGVLAAIFVGATGDFERPSDDIDPESMAVRATLAAERNILGGDDRAALLSLIRGQLSRNNLQDRLARYRKPMISYIQGQLEAPGAGGGEISSDTGRQPSGSGGILRDYFFGAEEATVAGSFGSSLAETDAVTLASGIMKVALNDRSSPSDYLRLLFIVMQSEDWIVRYLAEQEGCQVDFFVHSMMDLERAYNGRSDFSFASQIGKVERLVLATPHKFLTFAAYDPFRYDPEFTLVKKGLEAGAVGVKYYPPSGYSPAGMDLPPAPAKGHWFTSKRAIYKQYQARYGPLFDQRVRQRWSVRIPNVDELDAKRFFDAINAAFFSWLRSQPGNVPIFSHHTPGGFEAGEGYGAWMAKPCFWHGVLSQPEFADLRLILAHAGGGEAWFGAKPWAGSFDQQAYNLCVSYENVYCEFGHSTEILSPAGQRAFATRLTELARRAPPGADDTLPENFCDIVNTLPPRYPIRKKMIYGSDWMMVSRFKNRDFIGSFAKAFSLSSKLNGWDKDFFGSNAMRAIGKQHFSNGPASGRPLTGALKRSSAVRNVRRAAR